MGARVTIELSIPELWTVKDSRITALDTIAIIRSRVYSGKDTRDRDFASYADYSTKPIYVQRKGARLKPKGGRTKRLKAVGRKRTMKTMYFAGGYKEYKQKSRRRVKGGQNQTAEVDLTLSGALMNNLITTQVDKTGFTIGLSPAVQSYGYHVNVKRPFMGLSPFDQNKLQRAVSARIRQKLSPTGPPTKTKRKTKQTSKSKGKR